LARAFARYKSSIVAITMTGQLAMIAAMRHAMRMMHGAFPLALTAALAGQAQQLQTPVQRLDAQLLREVQAKLNSEAPVDVAWGGYLSQRYRLKGATADLCKALERWQGVDKMIARVVRLHLADGLLGSGGKVPAAQVATLLNDPLTRDAAFAIMAQSPRINREAILQLAIGPAERHDLARIAAGRLLITSNVPTPELGDYVLSQFQCKLTIRVRGGELDGIAWDTAVGLGGVGEEEPHLRRRKGFPPLPQIKLNRSSGNKDTMRMIISDQFDDRAIVLTRKESTSYERSELEFGMHAKLPQSELTHLVYGMSKVHGITRVSWQMIEWQDADSYLLGATEMRDALVAKLDKAVRSMRTSRWVGRRTKRDFRIPLDVRVQDERGDQATALPELPDVPSRLPVKR
jgi:hypothetical protein